MAATAPKQQLEGNTRTRLLLAAIACGPAAGLLLMFAVGLVSVAMSATTGGYVNFPLQVLWSGALIGAMVGWPFILFFGLPAHRLLYKRGSRKAGGYLLAGVIAGVAASVVVLLVFGAMGMFQLAGAYAGAAGVIAALCLFGSVLAAWLFWLIRRPDKDVPPPANVAAMFE